MSGITRIIIPAILAGGFLEPAIMADATPHETFRSAGPVVRCDGKSADDGNGTDRHELDEPIRVSFRLLDGERISGTMTAWDARGFSGSFGARAWRDVQTDDVWRVFVAVMDRDNGEHWLHLGRLMLERDDGDGRAESAFARARDVDPSIDDDRIDAIRADVREWLESRRAIERASREALLQQTEPEAAQFPITPWPAMTPADIAQARAELERMASDIASTGSRELRTVPAQHAIVHTDVAPAQAAALAATIDDVHTYMERLLPPVPAQSSGREGGNAGIADRRRVAVIFYNDFDGYQLAEVQHFNRLADRSRAAVAQYRDAHAVVVGWAHPNAAEREIHLVRAVVHAFLHRHIAAIRLPAWAHEGFALHVAEAVLDDHRPTASARQQALAFIRGGGDLRQVVSTGYDSESWAQRAETVRAVGMLLTSSLISTMPDQYAAWVTEVKRGTSWREAFATAFNMRFERFLDHSIAWYAVND
jgi:hypothetical protein